MTAIALRARQSAATPGAADLARWLAGPMLAAALAEVMLLRLVTRTAIHIPGIDEFSGPYRAVSSAGRFAFYAASVLVAVTLVLLVPLLTRHGMRAEATATGAVVLAAGATRLGLVADAALGTVVGLVVVLLTVRVVVTRRRLGPSIGLFGAAFLVATLHALAQELSGSGSLKPGSTAGLLLAAELLVVVGLLSLHRVAWTDRRDRAVGLGAGLVVLGVFVASSATTRILMLWTFGLSGYFPTGVYAVAAGVLGMALSSTWRRDRELAIALGLLVAGGLGSHSSYQSGLVVCAVALLALQTPDRGGDHDARVAGLGSPRMVTLDEVARIARSSMRSSLIVGEGSAMRTSQGFSCDRCQRAMRQPIGQPGPMSARFNRLAVMP